MCHKIYPCFFFICHSFGLSFNIFSKWYFFFIWVQNFKIVHLIQKERFSAWVQKCDEFEKYFAQNSKRHHKIHTGEYRLYFRVLRGLLNLFLKNPPIFTSYVFPIYNSKLHNICSTSNLVHSPFNMKNLLQKLLIF